MNSPTTAPGHSLARRVPGTAIAAAIPQLSNDESDLRGLMFSIAYRMTGSAADAEDWSKKRSSDWSVAACAGWWWNRPRQARVARTPVVRSVRADSRLARMRYGRAVR
jgi:hypothetical protein